jgi:hypothetical protein
MNWWQRILFVVFVVPPSFVVVALVAGWIMSRLPPVVEGEQGSHADAGCGNQNQVAC